MDAGSIFEEDPRECWLLIDGNNILVRAIKALENSGLSADGVPTGALHAFIQSIAKQIRACEPDRVVVCWDGGHAYRSALFPGYKQGRAGRGYLLEGQENNPFAMAKEFLAIANIHHVLMPGVEADDLIAHYCRERGDARVVIYSGDKDLFQLLDLEGEVTQVRPGDSLWTGARVISERECTPEQLPMVMALMGDTSDGIPGVRGIGIKTAVKLLSAHHWRLSELLDADVPRLAGMRDEVLRNYALVNLRDNDQGLHLPSLPNFEPTEPDGPLGDALEAFFVRYELHTIEAKWFRRWLWRDPEEIQEVLDT